MTNTTIKLIVKLFSLFSTIDKTNDQNQVRNILNNYLSRFIKDDYIQEFNSIYNFYIQQELTGEDSENYYKKISSKSVKVLRLLEQINKELIYSEKVILITYLARILNDKEQTLQDEYQLLETIALSLKVPEKEATDLLAFLLYGFETVKEKGRLTHVSKNKALDNSINFVERENLNGDIYFFNLVSAHMFFFYYQGTDQLFLNNREIHPGRIFIFNKGNSISSYKMGLMNIKLKPIYFTEIGEAFLKQSEKERIELEVEDPVYLYKNSEEGIRPFRFRAESFHLVGIVGSSGVGKSTLMKLLNGSLKPGQGAVRINGYDVYENKRKLKGLIGYVPQEDLLFEELTVYQNLYYNARFCFAEATESEIVNAVDRTLDETGLLGIRDHRVGNVMERYISGGQRKRLNLALELIREPQVLLVDEPTSGLSSTDSHHIMNLLRDQTLKGKLVIVNVHQPSSYVFKLLDRLVVMDKGGRVAYTGDPLESLVYFKTLSEQLNAQDKECPLCGNINPEQILEIIEDKKVDEEGRYTSERKVTPEKWYSLYRENIEPEKVDASNASSLPSTNFRTPSKWEQFKIYFSRNFRSKLANKQYLLISLLEAPLLAIILAYFTKYTIATDSGANTYIFSKNVNLPYFLFMSILVVLFIGMLVSAEEIFKDRKVLLREKYLSLSRSGYLFSKIGFLFALSAIQAITYVVIGNTILEIRGLTPEYWTMLFSTACFANLLGLNISSGLNSEIAIYVLIPILLIPQILFSGTVVEFNEMHGKLTPQLYPPFIADITTSRWAYEALAVEQFKDNQYEKHFYPIEREESKYSYLINYFIPELISYLDFAQTCYVKNELNHPRLPGRLKTLRNELKTITTQLDSDVSSLYPEKLNLNNIKTLKNDLSNIRKSYASKLNRVLYQKDSLMNIIEKQELESTDLATLKQAHHNQALARLVRQKGSGENILVRNHRLYRRYEPIYKTPLHQNGRAQFYTPEKQIGAWKVDTYLFNLLVIWVFIVLLYITLYYDLLKKGIAFLSKEKPGFII